MNPVSQRISPWLLRTNPKVWIVALVLAGCTADRVSSPDAGTPDAGTQEASLVVCHIPSSEPQRPVLTTVPESAAAEHYAHGDPIGIVSEVVHVNAAATSAGAGTSGKPFRRITDALSLLRCRYLATGTRGQVRVGPGLHTVTYDADALAANGHFEPGPIIIDFPVDLIGATSIELDGTDRPQAGYDPYTTANATFLAPDAPLGPVDTQPMILVADTAEVHVEGFVMRSGHCRLASLCPGENVVNTWGGTGIIAIRSLEVQVVGNVLQPGFFVGIDFRGSSGTLERNYVTNPQLCVTCITGGGTTVVRANRLEGGQGGVLASPSSGAIPFSLGTQIDRFTIPPFVSDSRQRLDIRIEDNLFANHFRNNASAGIRLWAYGRDAAALIDRQVLDARVYNNRVEGEAGAAGAKFGLVIDFGYTTRIEGRTLEGTIFADVSGNQFTVERAPIAVVMMRAQAILNPNVGDWRTLSPPDRGTIVVDSDVDYPAGFWVDHLNVDPQDGHARSQTTSCSGDAACSTATYRGASLPGICDTTAMTCKCPAGLTPSGDVCTDPTPPANTMVLNGKVIPPGTTLP